VARFYGPRCIYIVNCSDCCVTDSGSADYLFSTRGSVRKSIQFHLNNVFSANQLYYTALRL